MGDNHQIDRKSGSKGGIRQAPHLLAAVDLGSNSFRLHVGHHDGNVIKVLRSARESTQLASGLNPKGALGAAAMQRGIDALHRLGEVLRACRPDEVRVVGTNTLRIATNAAKFLPAAESAIGFPIEIISGEEEARLIYMGIAHQLHMPGERRLVIDIGGGSTELIIGRGQDIERAESVGLGTFWPSHHFFPDRRIDEASFRAAILYARSRFEDLFPPSDPPLWKFVYGSSGTMRAVSEILARNGFGGDVISMDGLYALMKAMIECGHIDRLAFDKLRPARAQSVVGGLAIMIGIMEELGIERIVPIEGGLRLGVMWDLHLRANQNDRREQSVMGFLERFSPDQARAGKVAEYATALYGQLKPGDEAQKKLLRWSALLHEVGLAVSPTNYHKHGAYLIENADLPGFTAREQRAMGKLILGQKGNLRKIAGALDNPDVIKAVLALRLAVLLLHARIEADFNELRLRLKNRIELEIRRRLLVEHPTLPYWMEREQSFWDEIGIPFVIRYDQ